MSELTSLKTKDYIEENKFHATIHDMIYKLIEDEETLNSIDFQESQISLNPQPILNPNNDSYIPYFTCDNNDIFLFQNNNFII